MEEFIKEFSGKPIGIIKTLENGDKIALECPSRKVLGYYLKSQDVTTDILYRPLSKGDTLVSLIYRKDI